ncbi:hypothetical protein CRG98_037805 [Punica granatum]|uniref:Uncharacterized protein n=1 Tax=Punica granatum TaxID=22663 RepID=A0A2I0ICT7_PUNGR|nr:hypothetical protein CRG98_037805 [Punica granatum]
MIETTVGTITAEPSPEVVDAVGLIWPLRIRFGAFKPKPPRRLCTVAQNTRSERIHIPTSPQQYPPAYTPNGNAKRNAEYSGNSPSSPVSASVDGSDDCGSPPEPPYRSIVRTSRQKARVAVSWRDETVRPRYSASGELRSSSGTSRLPHHRDTQTDSLNPCVKLSSPSPPDDRADSFVWFAEASVALGIQKRQSHQELVNLTIMFRRVRSD